MCKLTPVALCLTLLVFASVRADINLVDDNFDSYANDAAFDAAWPPDLGDGQSPSPGSQIGLLVPRTVPPFPPPPFDGSGDNTVVPPVEPVVGQAVAFNAAGAVNEWAAAPFSVAPSATQSIRYSADIFDFVDDNRRFSVGLRNDTVDREPGIGTLFGLNFIELGFWNADTFDPTDPMNAPPADPVIDQPSTAYAYRIILTGPVGGDLVRQPNWQYFPLDLAFDDPNVDHNNDGRFGNGDGLVNNLDVGPGWHTYSATISDTNVTLELDLFRDGTVDSTVDWVVEMALDPDTDETAPFTSLRMGGPSGVGMNEFTMVDNVRLDILELSVVDGDFDGNGLWNCADINALGAAIAAGSTDLSFDMNGDGVLSLEDVTDAGTGWLAVGGANNPGVTGGNPFLQADSNLDGTVDGPDFLLWNTNKFGPASYCEGDWNVDGTADGPDFLVWNTNKFQSSDHAASAVPEPVGSALLVGLILAAAAYSRRDTLNS